MSERSERIVSAEGTNPAAAKQRGLCLYKKNRALLLVVVRVRTCAHYY